MITKKEQVLNKFQELKENSEWSFAEFKPSETSKWSHGYHRYPAKFIPQVIEKLMDKYLDSEESHVNDPFFGCGTTIVSALSRGFKASGTEINQIAYLIAKVKSTPIEPSLLNNKIHQFLLNLESLTDSNVEPLIPDKHIERIDYWFEKTNKIKLSKMHRLIHQEKDEEIRDFFLVAFSQILKNTSIWLQKSTKPTRDKNKKLVDPFIIIKRHLNRMRRGNLAFFEVIPKKVRENLKKYLNIEIGDAKKQKVNENSVDLIISSSPYVTSYEYSDLHQLSTIWFDLADDLKEYKKTFIGTSHKRKVKRELKSEIALDIVNKLEEKSINLANSSNAFFQDMEEVFKESFRILKPGGRCCYVIGNTKLKGVTILNGEAFAESLIHVGFKLDNVIKRVIPSKILPQIRNEKTGRFASDLKGNVQAYPTEYIIIGLKE